MEAQKLLFPKKLLAFFGFRVQVMFHLQELASYKIFRILLQKQGRISPGRTEAY